jgi:hypothetical protein
MLSVADVIRRDAELRYLRKHARAAAVSVGLQLPSIVGRARDRYDGALHDLNLAGGQRVDEAVASKHAATASTSTYSGTVMPHGSANTAPSWVGQVGHQAASGFGKSVGGVAGLPLGILATGLTRGLAGRIEDALTPKAFGDRKDPLGLAAAAAAKSFGSAVGTLGVDLLKDIASKAMAAAGSVGDQAARDAILQILKKEDPVLKGAPDKVLMEAFHTMCRVAPVLSTDKNAVRSFLRQAATSGSGGVDFTSIKLLAEAERAVTGKRGD